PPLSTLRRRKYSASASGFIRICAPSGIQSSTLKFPSSLSCFVGLTRRQMPERSGLPSAVRGAGAVRFGLPSAVRGVRGTLTVIHCADTEAVSSRQAAKHPKQERMPEMRRIIRLLDPALLAVTASQD